MNKLMLSLQKRYKNKIKAAKYEKKHEKEKERYNFDCLHILYTFIETSTSRLFTVTHALHACRVVPY